MSTNHIEFVMVQYSDDETTTIGASNNARIVKISIADESQFSALLNETA